MGLMSGKNSMNMIRMGLLTIAFVMQSVIGMQLNDTVFLTILARDKAHMLPYYLRCIDELDYDKQLMTVYINTNNNIDDTEEILRAWADTHESDYKQIIFESHHVQELLEDEAFSHEWTSQKLSILGAIRNKSLQIAQECKADYYFVVDCDNFIIPSTLKHLLSKRKPIIAPMLTDIPNTKSFNVNFFGAVDEDGYFENSDIYWNIFNHRTIGTIEVPLVHCTYLIDMKYVDHLTYGDGSGEYEFIVFSRSARENGISQYICNEQLFGTSYAVPEELRASWTLDQEKDSIDDYFAALEGRERPQYPEKNMVVIIPSYNNKDWYEQNLKSVLSQNYSNFSVIYTDDCSSDGTGQLVKQYLIDNDLEHKVRLVCNEDRRGPLYNIYTMVHACDSEAIILALDGDDWFPDDNVLLRINNEYSSKDIWMTYGQFQYSSSGDRGWAEPPKKVVIMNNSFRQSQIIPTHLRTFYAWLFKQIKLEDLLYMGKMYPMAGDCAMMFPIIEMAGKHHKFISDIMYVYNDQNSISEHFRSRQLQMHLAQNVKERKRYAPLHVKPVQKDYSAEKAAVIIFAQSPAKLVQVLDSLKKHVTGIDHIFVMYQPTTLREARKYNVLRGLYPDVGFDEIDAEGEFFGDILFDIYSEIQNDYVLFIKGDAVFKQNVALNECINALDDTGAYAFYFKLNAQENSAKLPLIECKNNVSAWNFSVALDQWASANSLDCVLHKKGRYLGYKLEKFYGPDAQDFEDVWAIEGQLDRVGLCFNESHVAVLS